MSALGGFSGLRQIPVVERGKGPNIRGEKLIDEAAVKAETLGVWLAGTAGLDARPRDREAVAPHLQGLHDAYVFDVAVVVVAGDVTVVVVLYLAASMREAVPDRFALAVFVPRAFNLVRGSRGAPPEIFREGDGRRCGRGSPWPWQRGADSAGGRKS